MSYSHLTLENLPQVWEYIKKTRDCKDAILGIHLPCENVTEIEIDDFVDLLKMVMQKYDDHANITVNASIGVDCDCGTQHLVPMNNIVEYIEKYYNKAIEA